MPADDGRLTEQASLRLTAKESSCRLPFMKTESCSQTKGGVLDTHRMRITSSNISYRFAARTPSQTLAGTPILAPRPVDACRARRAVPCLSFGLAGVSVLAAAVTVGSGLSRRSTMPGTSAIAALERAGRRAGGRVAANGRDATPMTARGAKGSGGQRVRP